MKIKQMKHILSACAVVGFLFIAFGSDDKSKKSSSSRTSSNINNGSSNDESLETSKKAYRQGYADGQTAYGLPASESASAYEFYLAKGYNFSSADYNVYVMGYNDGMYGKSKQY